jgi:hypothetical protein
MERLTRETQATCVTRSWLGRWARPSRSAATGLQAITSPGFDPKYFVARLKSPKVRQSLGMVSPALGVVKIRLSKATLDQSRTKSGEYLRQRGGNPEQLPKGPGRRK